jgi:hypothetical protein
MIRLYFIAAMAILVAGLASWALIERAGKASALTESARLEAANGVLKANNETIAKVNAVNARNIERMLEQDAEDHRLAAALLREQQGLAADLDKVRTDIQTLGETDDQARNWLSDAIPDGVRNFLNRSAAGGGGASDPVRRPAGDHAGAAARPLPAGSHQR